MGRSSYSALAEIGKPPGDAFFHPSHQDVVAHVSDGYLDDHPADVLELFTHHLVTAQNLKGEVWIPVEVDRNLGVVVDEVGLGVGNPAAGQFDATLGLEAGE